jgi:hypothetical protein
MKLIRLKVLGHRITNNADEAIPYESLGIKKPEPDIEHIEVEVSLRMDTILYIKDYTLQKDHCVIGTDYDVEYIVIESLSSVEARLSELS